MDIGECSITFDHIGYDKDVDLRVQKNLRCLLEEFEQDTTNLTSWRHLALTLFHLGQEQTAEHLWLKCIDIIKDRGRYFPDESGAYIDLLTFWLGKKKNIAKLLEEAMDKFPDNPSLYWLKGKSKVKEGAFTEAVPYFERLLEWGKTGYFSRFVAHPLEIFDEGALDALAGCYFELGKYDKAKKFYKKAQAFNPTSLEYKLKLDLAKFRIQNK